MKTAFTTLGCPAWDMDRIVAKAVELGYDGVDFRGYRGKLDVFELPEFTTGLDQTVRQFAEAGLEVPCFSSSVHAFSESAEGLAKSTAEVRSYARLCHAFGAPFVRIFGGSIGSTPRDRATETMVGNLQSLSAVAADSGVQLLLETHDDWIASGTIRPILEAVGSDALGVLWDTHHPYRFLGETFESTWEQIGRWVRYTHWKDSYVDEGNEHGYQLCLPGEGDMPLAAILYCLLEHGYDGYLTFEWEKMWAAELPEPEIAFPQFILHMQELAALLTEAN